MLRGNGGWRSNETPQPVSGNFAMVSDSMDYYNSGTENTGNLMEINQSSQNLAGTEGKKIWKPSADGKVRKRKKKTAAERNLKLKKFVQPKNAVVCLNELRPGIAYNVEQDGGACGQPTLVSVEVDGQKYRGFGSTKQMAKQAAAEAALISFVKPPPSSASEGEDRTPWSVLASFAMYKLFNEWREGRVGTLSGIPPSLMIPGMIPGMIPDSTMHQTLHALLGQNAALKSEASDGVQLPGSSATLPMSSNFALSAYLGKHPGEKEEIKQVPNPAKQLPENAISMHPVMLLHQMKPSLVFSQSQSKSEEGKVIFNVSTDIDGQTFTGQGPTIKKAKHNLAQRANQMIFGIQSTYLPDEK